MRKVAAFTLAAVLIGSTACTKEPRAALPTAAGMGDYDATARKFLSDGDFYGALAWVQQAVESDPEDYRARFMRSVLNSQRWRSDDASSDLERGISSCNNCCMSRTVPGANFHGKRICLIAGKMQKIDMTSDRAYSLRHLKEYAYEHYIRRRTETPRRAGLLRERVRSRPQHFLLPSASDSSQQTHRNIKALLFHPRNRRNLPRHVGATVGSSQSARHS